METMLEDAMLADLRARVVRVRWCTRMCCAGSVAVSTYAKLHTSNCEDVQVHRLQGYVSASARVAPPNKRGYFANVVSANMV